MSILNSIDDDDRRVVVSNDHTSSMAMTWTIHKTNNSVHTSRFIVEVSRSICWHSTDARDRLLCSMISIIYSKKKNKIRTRYRNVFIHRLIHCWSRVLLTSILDSSNIVMHREHVVFSLLYLMTVVCAFPCCCCYCSSSSCYCYCCCCLTMHKDLFRSLSFSLASHRTK
jgi:hypothetical protein